MFVPNPRHYYVSSPVNSFTIFRDLPNSVSEADYGRGGGGRQAGGQPDHQPRPHRARHQGQEAVLQLTIISYTFKL